MEATKLNSNKFKFSKLTIGILIFIIITTILCYNILFAKRNNKLKRRNAMTEEDIMKIKNKFMNFNSHKNLKDQ